MLYLYVTINYETLEVMILDSNVLRTRLRLWVSREHDHSLIVFVNRYGHYWFFENTTQYRRIFYLKFECKLNFLHPS